MPRNSVPRWLPVAVAVVLALTAAPAGAQTPGAAAKVPTAERPAADQLVELVNAERGRRGLPRLTVVPRLAVLAASHSRQMGANGAPCRTPYLHHNTFLRWQVQPVRSWGENVGCARDVVQLHQALMESASHRSNVLGRRYNAIGVGTFEGTVLWGTQVFADVSSTEIAAAAAMARGAAGSGPLTRTGGITATPGEQRDPTSAFDPDTDWLRVLHLFGRWTRLPSPFAGQRVRASSGKP